MVGVLIAITGLKRLRQDYQAMAMLVVSLMAATVVSADTPFLNGNAGLVIFPSLAPFSDQDPEVQRWAYVGIVLLACAGACFILRRFPAVPFGLTLRAMRDDDLAAQASGKDVGGTRRRGPAVGAELGGPTGRW